MQHSLPRRKSHPQYPMINRRYSPNQSVIATQQDPTEPMDPKLTSGGFCHFALLSGLYLAFFSSPASSQIVVPTAVTGPAPSFGNAASSYVLNNSITCPAPTINVTGFGGDTDGSSTDRNEVFRSQSADVTSWGVALGLSIPLGGNVLREFCMKFAAAQAEFQETRTRNQERNSKLALLQQCLYIQDSLGIRISKSPGVFSGNGPLASFADCLKLSEVLDVANRRPSIDLVPAPKAPTDSASPTSTPVTITQ